MGRGLAPLVQLAVPNFTIEAADLAAEGPVIDLTLSVPKAVSDLIVAAGDPVPAPVKLNALVDTGASHTVVKQGSLAGLGLNPTGVSGVTTPTSQNHPCSMYYVRLVLPKNVVVETTVIEAPLQGQAIEALLGRDVLQHGILVYNGVTDSFTLAF